MKKALIWFIVLVIVIGGGAAIYAFNTGETAPQYVTVTAEKSDIVQTVEATGSVASADEFNLGFKTSGRIASIPVSIGDTVSAGQVLASIRAEAINADVDRARAAVVSAQADLDRLVSGSTSQEIKVSQEKVEKAQLDLNAARTALNDQKATDAQTRQVYLDTALQTLSTSEFVSAYALDVLYDAIIDSGSENFDTTQSAALISARIQYDISSDSLTKTRAKIDAAEVGGEVEALSALNGMRTTLLSITATLDNAITALSGAISNQYYSATDIASLKSDMNTQATAIATQKTNVQASISNLTTGVQTLVTSLNTAQASERAAVQALALAQAELNLLTADPEDYEIRQLQARVAQAQADLRASQSALDDTYIFAPTAGVITDVNAEVGEQASVNSPVITMIGESRLQIDVDIPEADINKISLNLPVSITLDAFGIDEKFTGVVSFIEPTERVIQDVVYYRVTVLFDEDDSRIKPGMTADISVVTSERADALALPLRAVVIRDDGSKTVRVLENGIAIIREVSTGTRGDDGSIEILSGLEEGEVVITGEVSR